MNNRISFLYISFSKMNKQEKVTTHTTLRYETAVAVTKRLGDCTQNII